MSMLFIQRSKHVLRSSSSAVQQRVSFHRETKLCRPTTLLCHASVPPEHTQGSEDSLTQRKQVQIMVGSITAEVLQTSIGAIGKVQGISQLTDKEKHSLSVLQQWLANHSSAAPGDGDDLPEYDDDEQAAEYIEAYTSSTRHSGALIRERVLRSHSKQQGLCLERLSDSGNGLVVAHPEAQAILERLASWDGFDIFELNRVTEGRPLEAVALALLQDLGLIDELQLPLDKLRNFLRAVEGKYLANPYHSNVHAADVVQTVGAILLKDELKVHLTPLELLSLVLAAIVHDVAHPGLSNDYLITTEHENALRYHDICVNENWHLWVAFKLLLKPDNNFLAHLPKDGWRFVRSLIVDIVLSTDMKAHHSVLADVTSDVGLFGVELSSWNAVARTHLLCLIMHAADIGNCVKPLQLSAEWARRVNAEFWLQGDKERQLGLPVSPLNDRGNANIPRSQKVFLELFARPCYEALARIAPLSGQEALCHYEANMVHWQELIKQGVTLL